MSKITVIRNFTILINYIHDHLILSKVIVWHAVLLFYILFFENGDYTVVTIMADHQRSYVYLHPHVKQMDTISKTIVQFPVQLELVWMLYPLSF